jgi:hypothetical protein
VSERWLPVPGFEGLYEVSDEGRARSLPRAVSSTSRAGRVYALRLQGKLLKLHPSGKAGHFIFMLPGHKSCKIHTTILAVFVEPRPLGLDGLHNDGDVTNNRLSNLRWGTVSENIADAVRHGTWNSPARLAHLRRVGFRANV